MTSRTVAVPGTENTGRLAFFDNARALLITLVVFGHALSASAKATEPAGSIYLTLYVFHMPAFAVVSGYFAKPDIGTPKGRSRFLRLFGILVAFQLLHAGLRFLIEGPYDFTNTWRYANFTLWWLVALLCWSLVLPLFADTKSTRQAIMGLAVAVIAAIISGFAIKDGALYSLSRTVVFFPYFLGGYYASRHKWSMRVSGTTRAASVALIVGVGILFSGLDFHVWQDWLQAKLTYGQMGTALWKAPFVRAGVLAAGTLLTLAFLQLVPRRRLPFITNLGSATLPVYLWHAPIIWAIQGFGYSDLIGGTLPRAVISTIAIVAITSSGPLARATNTLMTGRRKPLPAPQAEQAPGSAQTSTSS